MASTTQFDVDGRASPIVSASQGEVDYLYKIPTEIWIEIISMALLPIPPDSPFVFDAFSVNTLPRQDVLFALQKRRLGLLVICKTFRPIVEQLLFTDVMLRGQDQYLLFMSQANVNKSNRTRRGIWTKRLRIFAGYWEKTILPLDVFLPSFPNLISLDIGYKVIVRPYQLGSIGPENLSLKHLLWRSSSFNWETLHLIATQFPHLTQLGLFNCLKDNRSQNTSVTLKSLKHFIVSHEPIRYLNLARLTLPALATIKMNIDDGYDHFSDEFLLQHGPKVTELQLNEFGRGGQSIPTKSRDFDSVFQLLQVFTFNPVTFTPIKSSTEAIAAPHNQLEHLRLALNWEYKEAQLCIQKHAQYFTLVRFPNLRLITAIPIKAEHKEDIEAFLSEVFPHAVVNVDISIFEYSSI